MEEINPPSSPSLVLSLLLVAVAGHLFFIAPSYFVLRGKTLDRIGTEHNKHIIWTSVWLQNTTRPNDPAYSVHCSVLLASLEEVRSSPSKSSRVVWLSQLASQCAPSPSLGLLCPCSRLARAYLASFCCKGASISYASTIAHRRLC